MDTAQTAWIIEARRGNPDAAGRLVEEFHARIYAFLRRHSGTDSDAVELTQRTFCRAWAGFPGFAGRSSVSAWLHGIAYRTYVDWLRTEGRGESRSEEWWNLLADDRPTPDKLAADGDDASVVYRAVDRLDPTLRETIHLHYFQGLTLEETATALEIATSTVKYRVRQALAKLQRSLESSPHVPSPTASLPDSLIPLSPKRPANN